MDLKKEAAQKAISFIKDKSTVGLGAGSTIAYMVEFLAEEVYKGLEVKVLTSSFKTRQLLMQTGFFVNNIPDFAEIDFYFDGCDQMDKDLNALKSGGGIHTREKLLACMAKQFILVGDETKYSEHFDNKFPLVVEFLPEALNYVPVYIQKLFKDVRIEIRMSNKKDGVVITENGNYLLDVWFSRWPDLNLLNSMIKGMTGVVETSLFFNLAHKAIIAEKDGAKTLEKSH
jgi:ribose 5-phosphate isomerase A